MRFIRNKTLIAVFLCIAFFALGLFAEEGFNWSDLKMSATGVTTDELVHITGGYYYFQTHRYFINTGHPPLVKDLSALPLLLLHPVFPKITSANLPTNFAWNTFPPKAFTYSTNLEKADDSWDLGRVFLFNPQNNAGVIVFWARLSVIFFNSLFLFWLYLLLGRVWNKRAALVAVFLLVFSPLNLAHGSLVDMDFISSVWQMITLTLFALYLKEKKASYFWLTGLALALALLAKLSSLILLPVLALGGLVYVLARDSSAKATGKYLLRLAGIFAWATVVVGAVYAFHTWNMSAADVLGQMKNRFPTNDYQWVSGHVSLAVLGDPFVKGLGEYAVSVSMLSTRLTLAYQKIYFLGHVYGSQGAGLLYYPVLYFVKLTVGFVLLTLAGLFLWLWKRAQKIAPRELLRDFQKFLDRPLAFLLWVFLVLYAIPAFQTTLQLGLRYILPMIFAITLLTAKFIDNYWEKKISGKLKAKYLFGAAMATMVISVGLAFPYYLSYYNFLVGGTANGYTIATDSNYDWGCQDINRLASWVKEKGIKKIYVDIPGTSYPFVYYLGNHFQNYDITTQPLPPAGSLIAISAAEYEFDRENSKVKLIEKNLVTRLGMTVFVFRVP